MGSEILFRGKRLDNGEWVYGFFWKDLWGNSESCFIIYDGMDIEIAPATRGQYAGLTDINGVKIFEGDILHCESYFYDPYLDSFHECAKKLRSVLLEPDSRENVQMTLFS